MGINYLAVNLLVLSISVVLCHWLRNADNINFFFSVSTYERAILTDFNDLEIFRRS